MTLLTRLSLVAALLFHGCGSALVAQAPKAAPVVTSTPLLKTTTTWNGAPIVYSKSGSPEIQSVLVEIPPGSATAWHLHAVNNIAYVLEGKVRLELDNGTTKVFNAGESFAEVVNTWHRGTNLGEGPLRILVIYLGEVGTPLSAAKGGRAPDKH
jgi:quercetin dioxygenase-like cupin family protein